VGLMAWNPDHRSSIRASTASLLTIKRPEARRPSVSDPDGPRISPSNNEGFDAARSKAPPWDLTAKGRQINLGRRTQ
jgi:hypothetical protein